MRSDTGADEVEPFIIFSLARCGGTTLTHVLNCYPGIRCVIEPFTPSSESTPYGSVSEAGDLDRPLRELWREYNGIKHFWDPSGFPFGDTLDLNQRLLVGSGARIIFLTRGNNLRRIISDEISWQTDVWGTFTEADRHRVREFISQPLRVDRIEWQLDADAKIIPVMRKIVDETGTPTLDLFYEDLFAEGLELEGRLRVVATIRAVLGAREAEDDDSDRLIRSLLDLQKGQLNSTGTYAHIPGIWQIEARFGSDVSGWLRDSAQQEREEAR
jgi:hypothetical protein